MLVKRASDPGGRLPAIAQGKGKDAQGLWVGDVIQFVPTT